MDIATQNGVQINSKTLRYREVRAKCPFCNADVNQKHKFYLSLNQRDQVFKCWYCHERGGVFKFVSLLTGETEEEIKNRYSNTKSPYKPHPAEKLTLQQLQLLGYRAKPDWYALRKRDREYYIRTRDLVWDEWKQLIRIERNKAFQVLIVGIEFSMYQEAVSYIQSIEKKTSVSFLDFLLEVYSKSEWPIWAKEAKQFALNLNYKKHEGNPLSVLIMAQYILNTLSYQSEEELVAAQ